MIVAAEAAVLDHAVAEVGTPVRAVAVQEPVASVGVPVQHEVLAQTRTGLVGCSSSWPTAAIGCQ